VEENLLLPLDLNGRADAKGVARARALLERVGLAGRGDSFPERLSGGEQQRVAIARALIHEPDVILADEPTGNLDAENAAVLLAELRARSRSGRSAVLLVTHSAELARAADRAVILVDGQVRDERHP